MFYSIHIKQPTHTQAGKTARNTKYELFTTTPTGTEYGLAISMAQFCKEQNLNLQSLLRTLRSWPPGQYDERFIGLVRQMQRRLRGNYGKMGHKTLCPLCGGWFNKQDGVYAKRRKLRDASAPDSMLRLRPAEYYGEKPTLVQVGAPEAIPEAIS